MARFLLTKWHSNGATEFGKLKPGQSAIAIVEALQAEQRDFGHSDGVTWQIHEGDLVTAMIATAKL